MSTGRHERRRTRGFAPLAIALLLALVGCSTAAAPEPAPRASDGRILIPAAAKVLFFGDSWTVGYSAAQGRGYAHVVGEALGWQVDVGEDGSGTGFVYSFKRGAPLFPDRAAALQHVSADLVVVEGGLNDEQGDPAKFQAAVERTIHELRRATDDAPIVLLGPPTPAGSPSAALTRIDRGEADAARRLGVPYISPLEERWINPANVASLIDPATGHPSTEGHLYFGARVAQALEGLVRSR